MFGSRRIPKAMSFGKRNTIQAYNVNTLHDEISDLRLQREFERQGHKLVFPSQTDVTQVSSNNISFPLIKIPGSGSML